jgi:hypothetical protein
MIRDAPSSRAQISMSISLRIAMRPEGDFGIDPFFISDDARVSLTIGDFIKAYENVLA